MCVVSPAVAVAQTPAASRYDATIELERVVSSSPAAAADDFRFVVNRYWRLVRSYPLNGYADNALWQAGNLSMEAFRRFQDEQDKTRAAELFEWLKREYPHSPFVARVTSQLAQLADAAEPSPAEATIRGVQRELVGNIVRITVEMDREVPFSEERLLNPSRLFFDLKATKTVPKLQDTVLRYETGVVRQIRLGRQPNSTTRIVLDLQDVERYSVFTRYDPYRIVIDCERAGAVTAPTTIVKSGAAPPSTGAPPPIAAPAPPPLVYARPPASMPAPATTPSPAVAQTETAAAPVGKPVAPAANVGGNFSVARQLGLGVSRIVIDPGHGGHDPGAQAFSVSEAELVLDVSLRLEKLLQQQPGVDVILTRRTDEFIALDERTAIANRESADLFLSIHANASATPSAHGIETYFLNFALNRQAEAVAARENAGSGKTMNSLPGIIKAITLNNKLNESRDFASLIQQSLVRGLTPSNGTLKDLGVKQAPFMVLIGASMPSVLAEIAFVTNRQESRLLKSPAYRQKIAESLLAGILKYQQALKKVQRVALD
jgi:N-acetylmuramoyl-L-alanine amidase